MDSLKMEVGIEDCLHIEFEYDKSAYHLQDVVIGKVRCASIGGVNIGAARFVFNVLGVRSLYITLSRSSVPTTAIFP